ncbi:hypothetical protein Plhal703r1_c04g0020511 [Plasmopara halstedii]
MRRGVITLTCLVVIVTYAQESGMITFVGAINLELGEQISQQQEKAFAHVLKIDSSDGKEQTKAIKSIVPDIDAKVLDQGGMKDHETQPARSTMTFNQTVKHGILDDGISMTSTKSFTKDVATTPRVKNSAGSSLNETQKLVSKYESVNSKLDHMTSDVVDALDSMAGDTIETKDLTQMKDLKRIVNAEGTEGSNVKVETQNVDVKAEIVSFENNNVTRKGVSTSNYTAVDSSLDTVTSKLEGATHIVSPKLNDVVMSLGSTRDGVEQEVNHTIHPTVKTTSSVVKSLTTITNTTSTSVPSIVDTVTPTSGTTLPNFTQSVNTVTNIPNEMITTTSTATNTIGKPVISAVETVVKTATITSEPVSNATSSIVKRVTPLLDAAAYPIGSSVKLVSPPVSNTLSPLAHQVSSANMYDLTAKTISAPAPTNTVTDVAGSTLGLSTNTIAKPVTSKLKVVTDTGDLSPATPGVDMIANTPETTVTSVLPIISNISSPDVNKVTGSVSDTADLTANTVTKTPSSVIKAMPPAVNKTMDTLTNTAIGSVTNKILAPVTPSVQSAAELKLNPVTDDSSSAMEEETRVADAVLSTVPDTAVNIMADKAIDTMATDTALISASPTQAGTPLLSSENFQIVSNTRDTSIDQPIMSQTPPGVTPTTMPTEQTLDKEEEKTEVSKFDMNDMEIKETQEETNRNDRAGILENEDKSAKNHFDGNETPVVSKSPPASSDMTMKPSTMPNKLPFSTTPEYESGSRAELSGSLDDFAAGYLSHMNDPDVGDIEPQRTSPPQLANPSKSTQPDILTLPTIPSPALSSDSKNNPVSQEAQAKQAKDISGESDSGTSIFFALVGLAGCAAIVAIVAYMKKIEPSATISDEVRSSISTANGARSSWDSVYNDPLETRYSSIVMITPNGNGVCIL